MNIVSAPKKRDIERIVGRSLTYMQAKSMIQPSDLDTPMHIPSFSWIEILINFVLGLPRSRRCKDSIFFFWRWFCKMTHFILCHKTYEASNVFKLFFIQIVRLRGMSRTIVSDKDAKFLSYFWKTLWENLGTKLLVSTTHHLKLMIKLR